MSSSTQPRPGTTSFGAGCSPRDRSSAARRHSRYLWYSGVGFDPELVSEEWWPALWRRRSPLRRSPQGSSDTPSARIDRAFRSRHDADRSALGLRQRRSPARHNSCRADSDQPDDGYVIVMVHCDGDKELQIFDAHNLKAGPLARAESATEFCPPLLLHSTWMPTPDGRAFVDPSR